MARASLHRGVALKNATQDGDRKNACVAVVDGRVNLLGFGASNILLPARP